MNASTVAAATPRECRARVHSQCKLGCMAQDVTTTQLTGDRVQCVRTIDKYSAIVRLPASPSRKGFRMPESIRNTDNTLPRCHCLTTTAGGARPLSSSLPLRSDHPCNPKGAPRDIGLRIAFEIFWGQYTIYTWEWRFPLAPPLRSANA
jgi:hypothetical protein